MKQKDKIALQEWEAFHKAFATGGDIDTTLSARDVEQLRQRLEADPIEWMKHVFPGYAKSEFAPFHLKAIKRIIEHDEWYEVLSWARELAKSTIVMMCIIYLVLTRRKRFILLTSATTDAAIRLLTPYRINFASNERLIQLYGHQVKHGAWSEDDFSLRNGARFIALGAGSTPRGARNEEVRPDVILADDFDTDTDVRNPETLRKKWEWFNDALLPTRSISNPLLIVLCGNIIARPCIITFAGALADHWDIVNIRDKQGNSTWPGKNTEEMIDTALAKLPMSTIQKEYYNNPVVEGKIFTNLVYGRIPPLRKFKYIVIYGDPAPGESKKSKASYKGVWACGLLDNKLYILKGFLAQGLNRDFIRWYADLIKWVDNKTNVFCYIENNKLQDPFFKQVFIPLSREIAAKEAILLNIKPDTEAKTDKASRIESNLEPLNRDGLLIFNQDEEDNPHMQELRNQFGLFEQHLPYPADGPDCIEGAYRILRHKAKEGTPPTHISRQTIRRHNKQRL